jgi:hypothetical protein
MEMRSDLMSASTGTLVSALWTVARASIAAIL